MAPLFPGILKEASCRWCCLGVMMFFNPLLTFMTMRFMGYIVAIYLVLLGIDSIMAAFHRRDSF